MEPNLQGYTIGAFLWEDPTQKGSSILKISGPKVIKLFSYSTQLSIKFILLINIKMPTNVGILTCISMINTIYERLKAKKSLFVGILVSMSSWNFVLSWVEHEKSFITSGPGPNYTYKLAILAIPAIYTVDNSLSLIMSHFIGWHAVLLHSNLGWNKGFYGKKAQKCIRMEITIFKILFWGDIWHRIYGQKLRFKVTLTCCSKT